VEIWGRIASGEADCAGTRRPSLLEMRLGWNHLLVQNAHDANSVRLQPIKHNVLPLLVPAKPCTGCIARPAHLRILREGLETRLQALSISNSLVFAPSLKGVSGDGPHI